MLCSVFPSVDYFSDESSSSVMLVVVRVTATHHTVPHLTVTYMHAKFGISYHWIHCRMKLPVSSGKA